MNDSEVQLRLLTRVERLVQEADHIQVQPAKAKLAAIRQRMTEILSVTSADNSVATEEQLSEFLKAHPEILQAACESLVGDVLAYVDEAAVYYKRIKAERVLTEEERQFGRVLENLLTDALSLVK